MEQRVRVWDIVLIAALIGACFLMWFFPKQPGGEAVISQDGVVLAVLDLTRDQTYTFSDGTSVIAEKGKVWVQSPTCPDRVCAAMGKISTSGQVILCVPNRISVEIRGGEVDGIVG